MLVLYAGIVIFGDGDPFHTTTELGHEVGMLVRSMYDPQVPPGQLGTISDDPVLERMCSSFGVLFFVRVLRRTTLTSSSS